MLQNLSSEHVGQDDSDSIKSVSLLGKKAHDSRMTQPHVSRRDQLSGLTKRSKEKARRLLTRKTSSDSDDAEKIFNESLESDSAFKTGQLPSKKPTSTKGATNHTIDTLQGIGKSIIKPKEAFKSKATKTTAGQLSKVERPYLSQKADIEFLQAHDNLKRAESASSSCQRISDKGSVDIKETHRDRLQKLKSQRESLHAAWTTSRHVRRVRVVPPYAYLFPKMKDFEIRDKKEHYVNHDWLQWAGFCLLYYTQNFSAQYIDDSNDLPFDINTVRHYAERLVMASAAWQSWLIDVRAVYRWEDPKTTGKWCSLYVILWYTEHLMGFLYGYIIYLVIKNRYIPTTVDSLRDSTERAFDSKSKAHKFVELIDKHGSHNWLEPVLEELGPYAQVQLGDFANMLEVLENFYEWKDPYRTFATLFFFASCLLVTLLTDMAFCMKIVWFVAGGSFFLCWPIASLYPKYRYLVSPIKWVFWNIPTHAEWSFQYLRRQAQEIREDLIKHRVGEKQRREENSPNLERYAGNITTIPSIQFTDDEASSTDDMEDWQSVSSSMSVLDDDDLRSFRGFYGSAPGRLLVFTNGLRFLDGVTKVERWRLLFNEIFTIRKKENKVASRLFLPPGALEVQTIEEKKFRIDGMQDRDDAFNTIIALSGRRWQSLQPRRDEE